MSAIATAVAATMPAFIARVRLRAERRVLWLRTLWRDGIDASTRGVAITDEDVDLILSGRAADADMEEDFYRTNPRARQLAPLIEEADAALPGDPGLALLRRAYRLGDAEIDLLSLCIAADADPMLRRVYGYIHDDATLGYATPWLASALFPSSAPASFGPDSPLVEWRLARPIDGADQMWGAATPWAADPFATTLVLHGRLHDPVLGAAFQVIDTSRAAPVQLYADQLAEVEDFVRSMHEGRGAEPPIEIEVIAGGGAGKRTFAAQLCARLGANMLAVDVAQLQSDPAVAVERAFRVARLAPATNAIVYSHGGDQGNARVTAALGAAGPIVIHGSDAPRPRTPGVARKTIVLPRLTQASRRALWDALSDQPMPAEIAHWALTPAEIANVATVARAGAAELAAACRSVVRRAPGEMFSPLHCPYSWDDLVLPASVRQHLQELENQTRLRGEVFDDWGFGRVHSGARGVSALFAGPSGTGKTMAAQVLARSLGMELYRVDLAGVVNKYIGETEKHLKLVFDACERSNVLLFFDEADALFGQRTQVKDAHDRFANIEIDYLLQRMEQFDGLAVLATNRRSDLDRAFVRRLRFIIDFVQPSPAERLALWRRALPAATPAGEPLLEQIDFDLLATRLAMNGAAIKTSGLCAAFLARAEGTRIGMRHVLAAARREMTKAGIELRPGDLEAAS